MWEDGDMELCSCLREEMESEKMEVGGMRLGKIVRGLEGRWR